MSYEQFLARKAIVDVPSGIANVPPLSTRLKEHQSLLTAWALRRGRAAVFADTGLGKALENNEPVLTPHGWQAIGGLRDGDLVIGSDGCPTRVTGVFPQGTRDLFTVRFSDGAQVVCDGDHLWAVRTKVQRYRSQPFVAKTTRQILNEGLRCQLGWRHFIPMVEPVQFPTAQLPLDPYTLGALLGAGGFSRQQVSFTTADPEILAHLVVPAPVSIKLRCMRDTTGHYELAGLRRGQANPVMDALRALSLFGKNSRAKFIPEQYFLASASQRLDLLSGLLDTDGHVREDGNIEYTSSSTALISDVRRLVLSLGGAARVRSKETSYSYLGKKLRGATSYRLSVQLPGLMCPFRLSRKRIVWRPRAKYQPARAIVSIEPSGEGEATCISVEAEDSLYVCRDYVITHNTWMVLEWARVVASHIDAPSLILAPLAVSQQFAREAEKMGIGITICSSQADVRPGINVTNYQKLHKFDASSLGGVALDEASILKSLDGKTRKLLIESFRSTPFRLAATATPSPNDHTELGGQAEFLGVMSHVEMLATFFVHDGGSTQDWRLKGHAREAFWRWVCSWGAIVKMPSDLGCSDDGYELPELRYHAHTIAASREDAARAGLLFARPAETLADQRVARRSSLDARVAESASVAAQATGQVIVWCDLNAESEALARAIPGAVEVTGSQTDDEKEAAMDSFLSGRARVIVSKPSLMGFGLNLQCASTQVFCGVTHSFEAFYQAVRRSWRFGQERPVDVHVVSSELEGRVVENLKAKQRAADELSNETRKHVAAHIRQAVGATARDSLPYEPKKTIAWPGWVASEVA